MKNLFKNYSANENNPKWNNMISRISNLNETPNEIRSDFEKDYTRILHSNGYRRLKHKTQVFFSPNNDHICTRIEHVNHVESISYTIAKYFGLNTELTKAIATAHDIGHTPFGHSGEKILSRLSVSDLGETLWHEKNGLYFVDKIELLEDHNRCKKNLNLTYAVRDGIISHCGEVDENGLKPRDEFIDLETYSKPNEYMPYTWEGCVVKISDTISYLGRDIEDAISLGLLDEHTEELNELLNSDCSIEKINNSILINYLIRDLFNNSTIENGLCFSKEAFDLMKKVKKFNYENIYYSKKVHSSVKYFDLILTEIYTTLKSSFNGENMFTSAKSLSKSFPKLSADFSDFLLQYCSFENRDNSIFKNVVIFNEHNEQNYIKAILTYITGMTDNFAINLYNEIIRILGGSIYGKNRNHFRYTR